MSDETMQAFNEAAIKISEVQDQKAREALESLLMLYQEMIKDMRGYRG